MQELAPKSEVRASEAHPTQVYHSSVLTKLLHRIEDYIAIYSIGPIWQYRVGKMHRRLALTEPDCEHHHDMH